MSNNFDILEALWLRKEKKRRAQKIIEGAPPLTYTAKNAGTLKNYRIYGQTENGESVGDRTGNLLDYTTMSGTKGIRLSGDGSEIPDVQWAVTNYIPCDGLVFTINKIGGTTPAICLYDASKTFIVGKAYNTPNAQIKASVTISSNAPAKYIRFSYFISNAYPVAIDDLTKIMLNEGSTALPYEPYGYRVPVTVSNGTDTLTTPIYLPEQIRKVGDEAEYIDYAEQKQHRVRKNLLQNTATSQTIKGVTFTVNADGSITCSGILTSGEYADLVVSGVFSGDTDILENGNYVVSCANGSNDASLLVGNSKGEMGRVRAAEINISANLTWAMLRIRQADPAITLYPMIRKADITDDTYEPYIDNTEVDVTLPALPTIAGTNTLSVGTEVQPSKVMVRGKLKE